MLTELQEIKLGKIIFEEFGGNLSQDDFIDCCLQLFEDIAGLECLDDKQIQYITTRIWRHYVKY